MKAFWDMKTLNNTMIITRFGIKSVLTIIFTLFIQIAPATAQTVLVDRVIAIVDDDVVLASELQERTQQVINNIAKAGQQAPELSEIQQQMLDQLILESIQLQMASRAGVRISDEQLNASVQRIASQNQMSLLEFQAALEQDGTSYNDTREQIRRELLLQRIQQGSVNQRIQITEQEIANFLVTEEGINLTAPEYRLLHTLIPVTGSANEQQAKLLADQLYLQIQQGQDYIEAINSSGQSELNGSDLGWRKAVDLPSVFSHLTSIEKGETAAPFKSDSGYHLVKMLDKRGDGVTIDQTKARHILLKASAIRNEAATEAAINNLRTRIINGEDFAALAREHSEDIGSATEGGDLGWTSPGQLVGAFQDAMDNTEINDVSPAFKSQFGWHILQVTDRREQDVSQDLHKNIARNFIHQRKYDDELQDWLQKIRDEAYVDVK
jgi:peptidyl-prolyl cis-trans isomerase SurA